MICALFTWSNPAWAQEDLQDGFDLFEEATRLMLKGLMQELGPAWDELQALLDNLNAYEAPEVLPNGDIIIRRKVPLDPQDGGELEL